MSDSVLHHSRNPTWQQHLCMGSGVCHESRSTPLVQMVAELFAETETKMLQKKWAPGAVGS